MSVNLRQAATNPEVLAAPARQCIGGSFNGEYMQVALGHVLLVVDNYANPYLIGVSTTPRNIAIAKSLGTYAGHYVPDLEKELHWAGDIES
jgi:hypothetical protein